MNQKQSAHGGIKIELPNQKRNFLSLSYARQIVQYIFALLNMRIEVVEKGAPEVVYSDHNVVFKIPKTTQTQGENTIEVSAKRASISSVTGDILVCALWDEDDEAFTGSVVNVAKPPHLRGSLASETIWSTAWSYSYTGSDYQERTRTATGYAATKQRVNTPYRVGDEIWIIDTGEATGVLDISAADVTRIDLNIDARDWWTETEGCDSEGGTVYAFVARTEFSGTAVGSSFA